MKFIVWCKVSGGVTGTREAPLKVNGEVQYFDDRATAESVAATARRNVSPYSTASFSYTVREA